MEVEIKHLYRTCLDEKASIKLVKKYCKKFKNDITIIFDLRIKDYGSYNFDSEKKSHIIKISPKNCCFTPEGAKLDFGAEKYLLISTLLHELHHANQYEKMGYKFWNSKFTCASEIENTASTEYFSQCEVEAREFENKHIIAAVAYYNRCAPKTDVL